LASSGGTASKSRGKDEKEKSEGGLRLMTDGGRGLLYNRR